MTNDEMLENQIGNLGGEEPREENSLIGKKLKHVPGQKSELSSEQDEEMNEFLNRSRSRSKIVKEPGNEEETERKKENMRKKFIVGIGLLF